jgi:hypothetical protein
VDTATYYRSPAVRQRICDFLGGPGPERATCEFITADDAARAQRAPRAPAALSASLADGREICRSLWDREFLVAHLDVEYVNFDFPAEAYFDPERIFELQEPVARAVEELLAARGIRPLHILSGRGHHFVWQIEQKSPVFARLARLGREPDTLRAADALPHQPHGHAVPARLGAAFAGLALVMEDLALRVKETAAPRCAVPVELTAVEVGPSAHGREMISLDISEYGDPLHTRAVRAPFSAYLKPWHILDHELAQSLPQLFFVPMDGDDVHDCLPCMRDSDRAAALATRVSTRIPAQAEGTGRLLAAYLESPLRRFHDWFYEEEPHSPASWPDTYDRTPLDALPMCARHVLLQPNDLLLRPWGMRAVTRTLLALGWHPRHIAGLIRSKFERDHDWGEQWREYDPATRADFYVRVFAGQFVVGLDDLVDYNCLSAKEQRMCPAGECTQNLETFRRSALARRKYDHLAHRPFHGLFLPTEPL